MLGQALGEVGGVLRSVGVGRRQLRVVCCDAQAYEAQRVLDASDVRLAGGGGTNMGAGLEAASALRPKPDLIIVFTDGYTAWPPRQPAGAPVPFDYLIDSGQPGLVLVLVAAILLASLLCVGTARATAGPALTGAWSSA